VADFCNLRDFLAKEFGEWRDLVNSRTAKAIFFNVRKTIDCCCSDEASFMVEQSLTHGGVTLPDTAFES
jgi:hypothetical protein